MGRAPCCDKVGLKRGPWQPEEDEKLIAYIQKHGHENWRALPQKAGLLRCGKSCRLRWTNYLRPDIKRGGFSIEEDHMIIQLHSILGNRWSVIAAHIPGRTDNEIKNYWNTHLRKQLLLMGIDPITHRLKQQAPETSSTSVLGQMALWERARLQAESRLAREYLNFISRKHGTKKPDELFTEWLQEYFKSFGKYLDSDSTTFPPYNFRSDQLSHDIQFGVYDPASALEFGTIAFPSSDNNNSHVSLPQLDDAHFSKTVTLAQEELPVDNAGAPVDEYLGVVATEGGGESGLLHEARTVTTLENIITREQNLVAAPTSSSSACFFEEMSPLEPLAAQANCAEQVQEELDVLEFTKTESIPNNSEYWSTILKIVGA